MNSVLPFMFAFSFPCFFHFFHDVIEDEIDTRILQLRLFFQHGAKMNI